MCIYWYIYTRIHNPVSAFLGPLCTTEDPRALNASWARRQTGVLSSSKVCSIWPKAEPGLRDASVERRASFFPGSPIWLNWGIWLKLYYRSIRWIKVYSLIKPYWAIWVWACMYDLSLICLYGLFKYNAYAKKEQHTHTQKANHTNKTKQRHRQKEPQKEQ